MKGYVEAVSEKPDKFGKPRYAFKLKDDAAWYSCGNANPGVKKGEQVDFDYTQNGQWANVTPGTVKVTSSAPVVIEGRKGGWRGSFQKDTSKDDYWTAREARDVETQKRIQLQASRNAAIEVVSLLLGAGAVKLPEKETGRHKAIAELVGEWTERFQNETNSLGTPEPDMAGKESAAKHEVSDGTVQTDEGWN